MSGSHLGRGLEYYDSLERRQYTISTLGLRVSNEESFPPFVCKGISRSILTVEQKRFSIIHFSLAAVSCITHYNINLLTPQIVCGGLYIGGVQNIRMCRITQRRNMVKHWSGYYALNEAVRVLGNAVVVVCMGQRLSQVWHITEYEHRALPESSYGQFHSGDTYVVRWLYTVTQTGRLEDGDSGEICHQSAASKLSRVCLASTSLLILRWSHGLDAPLYTMKGFHYD